jgi:hypothetical protein
MKAQVTKTYTCPAHADIVSNSAGRNLNLSPKEKMKMEVVKLNNHTTHANVSNNNSEKCPECGSRSTKTKTG